MDLRKNKNIGPVLVGFVLITAVLAGSYFRLFDNYELDTLDARFLIRGKTPASDEIVLVEIGNDTIEQLGQFPIDRSNHAILVNALSEAGAKAVLLDIFFSEVKDGDEELQKAITLAGNVYLPHVFDIDSTDGPMTKAKKFTAQNLEYFAMPAKGQGHINIIPDTDGKFRRVPILIDFNGVYDPYLAFQLSADQLKIPINDIKVQPGRSLQYKELTIPLDERSNIIVNFTGKWGESYKHYSYVEILRSYIAKFSGEQPILDLSIFKNKICIIGLTAEGTTDLHPTPFQSLYPAVGIHAEVISSVLNRNFIARASRAINLGLLIVLLTGIIYALVKTNPFKAFLLLIGLFVGYPVVAVVLFNGFGWWMDLFYPAAAMVFTYLVGTLWKYILEWRKRIILENELQMAKKIQESFLPKSKPKTGGCEIAAVMLTARQVGGDLYDYLEFEDDKLGIMIGDVTGKGVPASLFMAMVVGSFKFFAKEDTPPEETLHLLNQKIMKESTSNLFVTMYYAVFDTREKIMSYGNGGHLPVIYVPKTGESRFLDVEDGLPIGMIGGDYSGNQISYHKGDLFVFYTDGITEATNKSGEMYGEKRLEALITKIKDLSADTIAQHLEKNISAFEPRHRQHDDVTFIVVKF